MRDDNKFVVGMYNKYLFASVLSILCSSVGSVVNNIVIGNQIATEKLAVTALVVPIYYIFATVGNLLGIGGSALCAKLTGEGRHDDSHKAFTACYLLMLAASAVLSALCMVCLTPLLHVLGVPENLMNEAREYAAVMVLGGVFTMGVYLAFNFLRLDGKAGASMLVFVLMAVVNVALDIVLVPLMNGRVMAVSLATSAGAAAASVMGALVLFIRGRNLRLKRMTRSDFMRLGKDIVRIGSPGAAENICILVRALALNRILLAGAAGALALSALSVVNSINSFALAITAGVSGTLIPFIGVFSAEHDTSSVRQLLRRALLEGGVMTMAITLALVVAPGAVAGLFGITDAQTLSLALPAVRYFAFSLPASLLTAMIISVHTTNGRTTLANVLTVMKQLLFVLGAALPLSGLTGASVFHCFWLGEAFTLLAVVVLHAFGVRRGKNISPITLMDERFEREGHYISFSAANSVESIMECVDKIGDFCENNELSPKKTMLIRLSLEEMLNSIRDHSLGDKTSLDMNVRILMLDDSIILRIRNGGAEFNPIKYYEDRRSAIDPQDRFAMLELGDSLGIKMIIDTARNVDYRRTFGVNNLAVLL